MFVGFIAVMDTECSHNSGTQGLNILRVLLLVQSAARSLLLASLALVASLGSLLLVRLLFLSVTSGVLVRLALLSWLRFVRLINGRNLLNFKLVLVVGGGHEEAGFSGVLLINQLALSRHLLTSLDFLNLVIAANLLSCSRRVETQALSAVGRAPLEWICDSTRFLRVNI